MSGPFASAPARGHSHVPEERERRPEEGRSVPGLWTFLAGSPGAQGAVARGPDVQMLCTAGTLQPPVGTQGKEVTLSVVEAGGGGEGRGWALVDGDEAGIGRECQLLAEDVMEEVEVVADEERDQGSSQELEEKTVEELGLERPGGPSEWLGLDALEALTVPKVELSSPREQNIQAFVRFMCMNHLRRKRHLAQRTAIIQGILGFWAKAIMNRPQVSVTISTQDEDFLSYMMDFKVRSHPQSHCKVIFFFWDNPYFWNTVIVKEYYFEITGYRARHCTPVHWFWEFGRGAPSRRPDPGSLNFLNWLSGHNCPESNRTAEVGLVRVHAQLAIDVGALAFSWEG
ncbi:hypothetical protein G4228_019675 [Cervus hanglu yarkandensis]|uniref:Testis-specific Y-encoded protein 1-like n=1 Tax=Cervus hanglu yarkandensis TaxID=84702 RepID=A0A833WB51_9CERV|nr:hypothetical protein G4228_019675 [Cervus hanglu yarkandensis]